MRLVLKIGGSTLFDGHQIKMDLIKDWINVITKLRENGHRVGLVVGGGKPARQFCRHAKELGATNSYQDLIGIEAARQNARLFIAGLPEAYPNPPQNYQELIKVTSNHDLIIAGGFQPGQSTNGVAALFAEHIKADYLFNISDISKIHDKDPEQFDDAQPLDELSYGDLAKLIYNYEQLPGTYALFDHIGLDIATRSNIKLVFINGQNPEHVFDVLEGKHRGTIVQ